MIAIRTTFLALFVLLIAGGVSACSLSDPPKKRAVESTEQEQTKEAEPKEAAPAEIEERRAKKKSLRTTRQGFHPVQSRGVFAPGVRGARLKGGKMPRNMKLERLHRRMPRDRSGAVPLTGTADSGIPSKRVPNHLQPATTPLEPTDSPAAVVKDGPVETEPAENPAANPGTAVDDPAPTE